MSNDQDAAEGQDLPAGPDAQVVFSADRRSRISMRTLVIAIVALIALNLAAFIVLPPFDPGQPDQSCLESDDTIGCLVSGTIHLPRPHEIWVLGGEEPIHGLVTFQVSITDSLFSMMVITLVVAAALILVTRRRRDVPGFFQNVAEWAYESMSGWSYGMGGLKAGRFVPIFAAFFMLILAFNWSGLLPGMGILPWSRAPTSDLNVTAGLALFAFGYFEYQGFRHLGAGGYLSRFFPFYEFRNGLGAGLIGMFVGLIELILEFVKPLTLAMRLFGNIYGGEVAIAIVMSLAGALLVPVALYGLEIILTFVQALIFATLTLIFILTARESHHEEDQQGEEFATQVAEEPAAGAATAA